jgi:hypothetical protein
MNGNPNMNIASLSPDEENHVTALTWNGDKDLPIASGGDYAIRVRIVLFSTVMCTRLILLSRRVHVYLDSNALNGLLPNEITNLTNLVQLLLKDNNLSGGFPTGIEKWQGLRDLSVGDNELSGSLPTEFGLLSNLQLALLDNPISGSLPSELGNLQNLQLLTFSNSTQTGLIPTEI